MAKKQTITLKKAARQTLPQIAELAVWNFAGPARPFLGKATSLGEFLATAGKLEPKDRAAIVDQAIVLLEGFYAHLPLKRAMHAIDPLQRLRLLRHRPEQFGSEQGFDDPSD